MASEAITEPEPTTTTDDMDLENPATNYGATKRDREETEENGGGATKKQKVDEKSVEEVRMEKLLEENEGEDEEKEDKENEKPVTPVGLGPKIFGSAVDMLEYFYQLLHRWPINLKFNKLYRHMSWIGLFHHL